MAGDVLIVGAGTGGTLVANALAVRLQPELRAGSTRITLLGEGEGHVFHPANLAVAFKGLAPRRAEHAEAPLLRKGVRFVPEGAAALRPEDRLVVTGAGTALPWDRLVLATGSVPRPDLVPGLTRGALNFHGGPAEARRVWSALQHFGRGRIVVAIAGVPYKSPPSPIEASFLLDDFFRARGLRQGVDVHLVTPYPRAYPAEAVAQLVEPMLAKRRIGFTTRFEVARVDVANRNLESVEGRRMPYDLLLGIPPHRGAAVVEASGLANREGWLPTDPRTLRVQGREDVWALGDATDLPLGKSGDVAHLQSEVVARNLLASMGHAPEEWLYNGSSNVPFETGHHQALVVSASYSRLPEARRPSRLTYAMKGAFGKAYWSVLRGRGAWLLHAYFGRTSSPRRLRP